MNKTESIKIKYSILSKVMDEKVRRLWAAAEARSIGWGGISIVSLATGMSRTTITLAIKELANMEKAGVVMGRKVRCAGGGRKKLIDGRPEIIDDIEKSMGPFDGSGPNGPLLWTCKSIRKMAQELTEKGHKIGTTKVCHLLHYLGYKVQSKVRGSGAASVSENERKDLYKYVLREINDYIEKVLPVVCIDLVRSNRIDIGGGVLGNNGGVGNVVGNVAVSKLKGHGVDYYKFERGNVQSQEISDLNVYNFVSETIKYWWSMIGAQKNSGASGFLVVVECGELSRMCHGGLKTVIEELSNKLGVKIRVCQIPRGTYKWKSIVHTMHCRVENDQADRQALNSEITVKSIFLPKKRPEKN